MTLIAAFAIVFAVPLFFGSWRLALAGLGAQALLVFLILVSGTGPGGGAEAPHGEALLALAVDLVLVRGLLGPWLLLRAARRGAGAGEFELFPGDLLHWVLAAVLVVASVKFAWRLYPADITAAAHLATAATEVLLGFFIVAHQRSVLGQALGMFTIENGAVLLEALPGHHWDAPVHWALTAVFLGLVLTVCRFFRRDEGPEAPAGGEAAAVGEFEAL